MFMRLVLPGEEFLLGLDGSENFPGFAKTLKIHEKSPKINEKSINPSIFMIFFVFVAPINVYLFFTWKNPV